MIQKRSCIAEGLPGSLSVIVSHPVLRWRVGGTIRRLIEYRAERFGTEYVDPSKRSDLRSEFRKQKFKKEGFKTGLDLFDEV